MDGKQDHVDANSILDDIADAGATSDEGGDDNASHGSKGTTAFPEDHRKLYRIDAHEYVAHARLLFEFIVQCRVIAPLMPEQ